LRQLFVTLDIYVKFVCMHFVDTEEKSGAVHFTALDSDVSEPGKQFLNLDMTSVCMFGCLMFS